MRRAHATHQRDTHAVHATGRAGLLLRFSLFRVFVLVLQAPIAHKVSLMSEVPCSHKMAAEQPAALDG